MDLGEVIANMTKFNYTNVYEVACFTCNLYGYRSELLKLFPLRKRKPYPFSLLLREI